MKKLLIIVMFITFCLVLIAEQPKAPSNVNIAIQDTIVIITWDPVTVDTNNHPITVTGYIVYYNALTNTDYWQILKTGPTSVFVVEPSGKLKCVDMHLLNKRFYIIKAYQ